MQVWFLFHPLELNGGKYTQQDKWEHGTDTAINNFDNFHILVLALVPVKILLFRVDQDL